MKRFLSACLVVCCTAAIALGGELSADDAKALIERAAKVKDAFDRGDADTIIQMTHPSIYRLTNGKEGFEALTRQSIEQVKALGIIFVESSLGAPSPTYSSGADTVCFIPRTSILAANGKKVRSIGFLIAVRGPESPDWLFLDGSGLRKNPELLKTLLPGLSDDVSLPENRKELIE